MLKRFSFLLGVVLFLLFISSCSSTKDFVSDITLSEELTTEEKLEFYGGKHVSVDIPEMYFDGEDWKERMIELISSAEDYIFISSFLGSSSEEIECIYDILEEKARSGVDVYIIIDGTSNLDMTDTRFVMTPLNYLRESGVNLLIYSPMSFTHLLNPASLIVRDHRKMLVIDGETAVIGGMNVNYISMGAGEKSQRDAMYVFSSSSLCSLLVDEFASIWNDSSVIKMDASLYKRENENETAHFDAWLFNHNAYSSTVSLSGAFGSIINAAESSIFLCPYLTTLDDNMLLSLKKAVDRGVDTEVWCSVDSRGYARSGGAYAVEKFIKKTGVTFYDVSNASDGTVLPLFHMKALIVDDRYIVIGSSNFNYRSMALSHELALVIDCPEMAKEVKENIKEKAVNPVLKTLEDAEKEKEQWGNFFWYLFTYFGG